MSYLQLREEEKSDPAVSMREAIVALAKRAKVHKERADAAELRVRALEETQSELLWLLDRFVRQSVKEKRA